MNKHHDKTAVITGGSSGMGLATARLLLDEGARVAIIARGKAGLAKATADLNRGADLLAIEGDLSQLTVIDQSLKQVSQVFGPIDILFVNAGTGQFKPAQEFTEADFDSVVALNFKGAFFAIQKALPLLRDGGSIVLNASWTLHRAMAASTVYSATKAAVHNLARTFAVALAARRIRVNSVSPQLAQV